MNAYLIIAFLAFISLGIFIANNSQSEFIRIYREYKKEILSNNKTVENFLEEIKSDKLLGDVSIAVTNKELEDGYFKSLNTIRLNKDTIYGNDLASFCIVAHEFGHAQQNANKDKKYVLSNTIRKASKILGSFTIPLAIVGFLILFLLSHILGWVLIGISIFSLILILISNLLITIVEFDASKRAISILKQYNILNEKEIKKAKKFLRGAGYTYLGNFCSTLFSWTFLVPNPKII